MFLCDRDAREGEYEWVREYLFDANVNNSGVNPTFLLQFEGGECKYLDLNTRLKCNKRTRSSQGSDISKDFIRPSKVRAVFPTIEHSKTDNVTCNKHDIPSPMSARCKLEAALLIALACRSLWSWERVLSRKTKSGKSGCRSSGVWRFNYCLGTRMVILDLP
jgi:hypothetical protein